MKITKDLIGKKIRRPSWGHGVYILLGWFHKGAIAGIDEIDTPMIEGGGAYYQDWELYEEKKLPSQRIVEIINNKAPGAYTYSDQIGAIIQFLDEESHK